MNNSASSFSSFATPLPSCDAWGLVNIASGAATLSASTQIGSVAKSSTGIYTVSFSNPKRFGGGYYGIMMTPEFANDQTSPTGISYGMVMQTYSDFTAPLVGLSSGFKFSTMQFNASTEVPQTKDFQSMRVNIAVFSFSGDGRTGAIGGGVTGGTYDLVPGAGGYGVTGSTYSSAIASMKSIRTCTAYGTVVIPPVKDSGTQICAYLENCYNVKGVSTGSPGVFDITFVNALSSSNYCVILSEEHQSPSNDFQHVESALLLIRAGNANQYKTNGGFRMECLRRESSTQKWKTTSYFSKNGLTQRIHFMVFGGGTYGQP